MTRVTCALLVALAVGLFAELASEALHNAARETIDGRSTPLVLVAITGAGRVIIVLALLWLAFEFVRRDTADLRHSSR